jgi:hypothetical protein
MDEMQVSEDIDFDVIKEVWNFYKIDDGTILKIKMVLLRVIQDPDPLGNLKTGTLINTIIAPIPPKELRNKQKLEPKFDMGFSTMKEDWNEYDINDGTILKIKPTIAQIDRTDKLDPRGEPLYVVNMQPFIKKIPKTVS